MVNRASERLNQRRVIEKRFEGAQRQEKRYPTERENNLMRDGRMKAMLVNSQYLKNQMPTGNLNYEIFRQGIVIALCAVYGASIFNGKNGPFG